MIFFLYLSLRKSRIDIANVSFVQIINYNVQQLQSSKDRANAEQWFSKFTAPYRALQTPSLPGSKLCINNLGQLGNKLFQFAAAYSLSRYLDKKLVVDADMGKLLTTMFNMRLQRQQQRPVFEVGTCHKIYLYLVVKKLLKSDD